MSKRNDAMAMLLQVVNDIKKTGFTYDSVDPDFYLGGDLGIDSREMLEIWYELEQRLGIRVPDSGKRDLYTLADVVNLLEAKLDLTAETTARHADA
ncbi:MAG: acyl carrier protein [Nevskiaceae bacterium]